MNNFKIALFTLLINYSIVFANPNINARTAIVLDFHSNKVLFELEPDMQIYPASMTKIMTSIVAFDLIEKNKLSLDDKFVVSENAWRLSESGYSSMFIMVNDEVTVENLLAVIDLIIFLLYSTRPRLFSRRGRIHPDYYLTKNRPPFHLS